MSSTKNPRAMPHLPSILLMLVAMSAVSFGADSSNFLYRLKHAGFVVGHHDGDQLGVRSQGPSNIGRIDQTTPVHWNVGDLDSPVVELKMLAGIEHRMMFNGRGDNVIARMDQAKNR